MSAPPPALGVVVRSDTNGNFSESLQPSITHAFSVIADHVASDEVSMELFLALLRRQQRAKLLSRRLVDDLSSALGDDSSSEGHSLPMLRDGSESESPPTPASVPVELPMQKKSRPLRIDTITVPSSPEMQPRSPASLF